ncbi:hypothetical protein PFISCL1PPCAC_13570, partial [Pristionchus fissidentatus]
AYEHGVGIVAHLMSALAFYLMVTKTPETGRLLTRYLMLVQAMITVNDFNIGVLFCPIVLLPAPASICLGLLCYLGMQGHVALTITFCSIVSVAVSIVLCFHFKWSTVVEMTKYRHISVCVSLSPDIPKST